MSRSKVQGEVMSAPQRFTPKITLHGNGQSADVYMSFDPDGKFVLYGPDYMCGRCEDGE